MSKTYIIDNPKLMKTWNWEKNNKENLSPDKIFCGTSRLKVWWLCAQCKHEWRATPNNRSRGTNCPVCTNRIIVSGINDLQTHYPLIAKRWHPTLNTITPNAVSPYSNKKAYWTCEKDTRHYFYTRIDHMVNSNIICPVCANQTIIVGVNDLATTHPQLVKEWDFEKNIKYKPQDFTYGNSQKIWWKCKKEHSWKATISSRTTQKCGCPICSKELRVSFPETIIAYYLSKEFHVERSKHFSWLKNSEIDIYLPEFLLGIEYDGAKWHKDIARDIEKDKKCLKNNIQLIRIREPGCIEYNSPSHKISMSKRKAFFDLETAIESIFNYIKVSYHIKKEIDINIQRDYDEILQNHLFSEKEYAINDKCLLQEWHHAKNHPLTPDMFSKGSHKKVWWICSLGHEWKAAIYSRTNKNGCNCPYCAGQKVIPGWNDLQTLYPEIAKEWDFEKNGDITPNQIRPQTNKHYWWICSKCNYSWQANSSHRIRKRGCPQCGRARTIQSRMKKVKNLDTDREYPSAVIAGRELNIKAGSIRNCCTKKTKTAGGYHWIYID